MSTFSILCLLVLAELIFGRPVSNLLKKFINVDWSEKFTSLVGSEEKNLKGYALCAGRMAAKPILTFYYVITHQETSLLDKVLIFAAMVYVLSPGLLSKRVFSFLGILDDTIAVAFVLNKVADKVTPEITQQVESKLNEWFAVTHVETVETIPVENQ